MPGPVLAYSMLMSKTAKSLYPHRAYILMRREQH